MPSKRKLTPSSEDPPPRRQKRSDQKQKTGDAAKGSPSGSVSVPKKKKSAPPSEPLASNKQKSTIPGRNKRVAVKTVSIEASEELKVEIPKVKCDSKREIEDDPPEPRFLGKPVPDAEARERSKRKRDMKKQRVMIRCLCKRENIIQKPRLMERLCTICTMTPM